ncbi:unnamed protein product [Polarella glacialis]|uniref:Polynucleotide adenylyltransferase n=1 Tax=Polarella glacialis TaxID=89957 RepID=A0A813L062_POLGL|nr:unnamed protein product [Polarella glacialis]
MTLSPPLDGIVVSKLTKELKDSQRSFLDMNDRERAAKRIRLVLQGIARQHGLSSGKVEMFGSFLNGFKTGTSDLDIVFVGSTGAEHTTSVLGKFAQQAAEYGFENITKIFQASVPLLKLTDTKSQLEVDFCINNQLGVRNSLLLSAYCKCDSRVLLVGRLVKDWAKKHELVGTADGCLNSYAYMLLVIFFLQSVQPPVLPNLQSMATETVPVKDFKWGGDDCWETKFESDVTTIPQSKNVMPVGELMIRFFHFFTRVFDWRSHAVCMRLKLPGAAVDKFSLTLPTNDDQWYVEDPFDLKHNLAGKCSRVGRQRILDHMDDALQTLSTTGNWSKACPPNKQQFHFMKCRVSQGVTPQALLEEFEAYDLIKLHFPKPDGSNRMGQAFLEFADSTARRRAHTLNEKYIADCQLQLHYSTQHSLAEAVGQGAFSTYEMASYKMQRQVLAARVESIGMGSASYQDMGISANGGHMQYYNSSMMNQSGAAMTDTMAYRYFGQQGQGPCTQVMVQRPPPPPPPPLQQAPQLGGWDQSGATAHHNGSMQVQMNIQPKTAPRWQSAVELETANGIPLVGQWLQDQPWLQGQPWQQQMKSQPLVNDQHRSLEREPASLTKNNGVQILKPATSAATSSKDKRQGALHESTASGWLDVPFSRTPLPPGQGPLFTPQQSAQLSDFQQFLARFEQPDSHKGKPPEIVLQAKLTDNRNKQPGSQKPLLSPEESQKLQTFRAWFEKFKAG